MISSRIKIRRLLPLLVVAGLLVSCDTPKKRGLRELAARGIQPSGEALIEAVQERDAQRTVWLTDIGVYTEQCDSSGRTPLRIALENRDVDSVHKLLDAKADVNAATADHVSVLGIAMEQEEETVIVRLLAAGARADGLMPDGETILSWAVWEGRTKWVRLMMNAGADPQMKDRFGNSLLHVAMEAKHHELTGELIDLGADPAATNAVGETTLHFAFRNGWLDLAPALASAGVDADALGVDGLTLLDRAALIGNCSQIEVLLKIGADPNHSDPSGKLPTPLEHAFASDRPEVFQVFLDQEAKPADGNWGGWLWKALETGNVNAARLLISHGVSPRKIHHNGLNLVEAAALVSDGTFVKLFRDYHVPSGNALYQSAVRGDLEMVDLLVACGAAVNVTRVPSLDTPLVVALRKKQDRVAAFLLRHGADVELRNPEGQSPLHMAAATGCTAALEEMLIAGLDPNSALEAPVSPAFIRAVRPGVMHWLLKNDRNITPLMIAADSGNLATTRLLLKAGAKREVWTHTTRIWPINFASRRNDVRMMRLFLGRDPLREDRWI
jgi:ankyrin repeat protein